MPDPRRRSATVDPDRLAQLEEERDFLLRSLDDLDREHAAGDVDDADYEALREGYVARTAATLHEIRDAELGRDAQREASRGSRRWMAWVAAVVVFASAAGVLLARSSGFRAAGTSLTGTGAAPDEEIDQCQGQLRKDPAASIACFDRLLRQAPDDVEALTYRGWAKVLSGDLGGGNAAFNRVVELDPSYPTVYVFRASAHRRADDFGAAQAELDRLYSLNPPAAVLDTLRSMGLEKDIAVGLLSPATRACWEQAEPAMTEAVALEPAQVGMTLSEEARQRRLSVATKLAAAMQCLDGVLAAGGDATAYEIRCVGLLALAHTIGGQEGDLAVSRARSSGNAAVELAPKDPTAHLVRGTAAVLSGDAAAAKIDLDVARTGRISPLFAAFLTVDSLSEAIDQLEPRATSTTTTGSTSTTTRK